MYQLQLGALKLTRVTSWDMYIEDMIALSSGDIAVKPHDEKKTLKNEIHVMNRKGKTHTTYKKLCKDGRIRYICELIPGKYFAELCNYDRGNGWHKDTDWNDVKVVDMATQKECYTYSGHDAGGYHLMSMCSGPGEGSLLVWDNMSEGIIHLQWNEADKKLERVRRVHVLGEFDGCVRYMCYVPKADLVILSRPGSEVVQAIKMPGETPVWQQSGTKIKPEGISCDEDGRVYIANGKDGTIWVVNGYNGEVIDKLGAETGMGKGVYKVCCLNNPSQLLVYRKHNDQYSLTLFNMKV